MSRPLLKLLLLSLLLAPTAALSGAARAQEDCGLPARSRRLEEYGELSAADEKPRLERLAAALDAEPDDTVAFVVAYAGRAERAGAALRRADRIKAAVTDKYLRHYSRVNTLDCGRRESPAVELWLTPAGASPPRCSPTLDPLPVRPRRRSGRP